jgi:hypothetical protein
VNEGVVIASPWSFPTWRRAVVEKAAHPERRLTGMTQAIAHWITLDHNEYLV